MRSFLSLLLGLSLATFVFGAGSLRGSDAAARSLVNEGVLALFEAVAAGADPDARGLRVTVKIVSGAPDALIGPSFTVKYRDPKRVKFSAEFEGKTLRAGRNGGELWVYVPHSSFGVVGKPDLSRFQMPPGGREKAELPDFPLPLERGQVMSVLAALEVRSLGSGEIDGYPVHRIKLEVPPYLAELVGMRGVSLRASVRESDARPLRLTYQRSGGEKVVLRLKEWKLGADVARKEETWGIPAVAGDRVEDVPLGMLLRFIEIAWEQGFRDGDDGAFAAGEGAGDAREADRDGVHSFAGNPLEAPEFLEECSRLASVMRRSPVVQLPGWVAGILRSSSGNSSGR